MRDSSSGHRPSRAAHPTPPDLSRLKEHLESCPLETFTAWVDSVAEACREDLADPDHMRELARTDPRLWEAMQEMAGYLEVKDQSRKGA